MSAAYVSHADLGATACAAGVQPEPEGELWHAAWEPRVLALTLAMGATGMWNIDMSRSARETLPDYRTLSYYAIWLHALERLLVSHGLVTAAELASGLATQAPAPIRRVLHRAEVAATLARGSPTLRAATAPARFALGDVVRTARAAAPQHTRLPGYARGRAGRITRVHGVHVFADAHAHGLGEQPQWLYGVEFDGLAPGSSLCIDAWEPYLERA